MINKIAKLLDFNLDVMGIDNIIEEFNHKYKSSWVLLDKEPIFIHKLSHKLDNTYELLLSKLEKQAEQVTNIKAIENFLPKTGLYANSKDLIYLYRLPNRQWTKSFSIGANYAYKRLKGVNRFDDYTLVNILTNPDTIYEKETCIFGDCVYLHWKKVGIFNEPRQTIYVTDNRFIKELNELWPQFQISLDAKPQINIMGENLILGF